MDDLTLDLAYVGSANKRQIGYNPINAALTPGPGDVQARRLLPNFGDLDGGENRYSSNYNSFRANLIKRFSKGLQVDANYTWGRAMDNTSSLAEARTQNPYDLRAEWIGRALTSVTSSNLPMSMSFRLARASSLAAVGTVSPTHC